MHLQNRVDPFGSMFRTAERGTIMGNRGGVLHRDREIVRSFKSRRWITCLLEFKGRKRVPMTEGRYTELFFLDEAVAFAAGHRPCAECRRERFNAFREAWRQLKGMDKVPFADEVDVVLHAARIDQSRNKVTWQAELRSLPDGCFVQLEERPYLVWRDGLFLWTPRGYERGASVPKDQRVSVLTPEPVAGCFRAGYKAEVHHSAGGSC